MKVSGVMTREPVTCRPEDSDSQAARMMWERDCGVLPVVDSDERLVGIVTDRDLCMGAYTKGRALGEMRVAQAMSGDVHACRAEDDLAGAIEAMADLRVRRLPVVDGDHRLVGMLSMNDVFRHVAALPEGGEREAMRRTVLRSMAAICEPRSAAMAR